MGRLFLDANVLFSAAYEVDAGLLKLWKLKNVSLCSSRYALEEAKGNPSHPSQHARLNRLSNNLNLFDPAPRELPPGVSLPEKDIPILLAALAAEATHLLTGDKRHFGPYSGKSIEGMIVLTPGAYLKKYAGGG